MKYKKLAEFYEEASGTTKRLEKIKILSKFLKDINESDKDILYLLLGDIYPEYDERRIGISNQLAIKVISKSTGTEEKQVVKEWKNIGDLGKVAEKLRKEKKQSTLHSYVLTTEKVLTNLRKLPELVGKGTVSKKLSLITELLTSASPLEALYLTRTLIGDLRIGIKESTIKASMVSAFFPDKDKKEVSKKIQDAIDKSNDIALVFEIAKKRKLKNLEKVLLEVGKPIKAMLAQKTKTIAEGFKALGKPCAVEYKYDGFRLIIHKKGDNVILFTRSLENVTKQFPEVIDYVKKYVKGKSFILDSEAVGFDKKTKEYKPFQDISQRIRRKYNIDKMQKELPVEINVFDILYYNGKSLLHEPFEKRTALIKKILKNHKYRIIQVKQIITGDEKRAKEFYKNALKDNQEGIMMKNLEAKYNPGSRVGHMLKVKPDEKDLDLVIVGAEYGTGKRKGWMSSFILACKNGKEFLEIGKMGTGIKEKEEQGTTFEEL
ncbi:MAG TPA: ATP-dependent DNA ligase, partial [Ignavibacteria bacterium]|nr:ATP-dependent DNA ligase [Ignavibacteria bacterium]